jgi:soluble lytic murein transglycosylase-like protein
MDLTDEQIDALYDAQVTPKLTDAQIDALWEAQQPAPDSRGAVGKTLDFLESASRNLNPFQPGGARVFGLNENYLNREPEVKPSDVIAEFGRGANKDISPRQAVLGPVTRVGNALTLNAFDDIVAGGNAAIGAAIGEDPRETYEDTLAELQGYSKDLEERSLVGAVATDLVGVAKLPIPSKVPKKTGVLAKTGQAAKEGAVLGAAYEAGKGNLGAAVPGVSSALGYSPEESEAAREDIGGRAKEGALYGGVAAGGIQGVGSAGGRLFNYLGEGVEDAANASKARAFGVTKAKMKRQLKKSGHEIGEEFDDVSDGLLDILENDPRAPNPYIEAIDDFRADGGTQHGMKGKKVQTELKKQINGYSEQLEKELSKAQISRQAIQPEFRFTADFVADGVSGIEKSQALKIANEAVEATAENLDGTILSLQREKVRVGDLIKEGNWGEGDAGQLKEKIYKRIYGDLRRTIEESYQSITGNSSTVISELNRKIGLRSTLQPLIDDAVAAGQVADPINWLIRNIKTTGGFGTATLGAGYFIGPTAAGIPLAGGYLLTPKGRLQTADFLQGPYGRMIEGGLKGVGAIGSVAERLPPKITALPGVSLLDDQVSPGTPESSSPRKDPRTLRSGRGALSSGIQARSGGASSDSLPSVQDDKSSGPAQKLLSDFSGRHNQSGRSKLEAQRFPVEARGRSRNRRPQIEEGPVLSELQDKGRKGSRRPEELANSQLSVPSANNTASRNPNQDNIALIRRALQKNAPNDSGKRELQKIIRKKNKPTDAFEEQNEFTKSGFKPTGKVENYPSILFNDPAGTAGTNRASKKKAPSVSDSPITDDVLDAVRWIESRDGKYTLSPAGARGHYQFMPATAKAYGVDLDDGDPTDDRAGAKRLLEDEFRALGSLELALAAYNAGRPAVMRAIQKAETREWEQVRKYLPAETRQYVPKFYKALERGSVKV